MKGTEKRRQRMYSDLIRLDRPRGFDAFSKAEQAMLRRGWRHVGWAAHRDLDPPDAGSPADEAFGILVKISEVPSELVPAVVGYMARKLVRIGEQSPPRRFEREVNDERWAAILAAAGSERAAVYIRSRLMRSLWTPALKTLWVARRAANEASAHDDAVLERLYEELAEWFPRSANSDADWSTYAEALDPLVTAARLREDSHPAWRKWLEQWLKRVFRPGQARQPKNLSVLGDLAALTLERPECEQVVQQASIAGLAAIAQWSPPLFHHLAATVPSPVVAALVPLWDHRSFEKVEWTWSSKAGDEYLALRVMAPHFETALLEGLTLHLGLNIGLYHASRRLMIDPHGERISEGLGHFGLPAARKLPRGILVQARLWRALQALAKYEAEYATPETERLGLRTEIMELAAAEPDEWVRALPWILECSQHLKGLAEAVTIAVARDSAAIGAELRRLSATDMERVRDRARGILALMEGMGDPAERLAEEILSFAVRQLDGSPLVPQPLATTSSTWLDSQSLEALLRSSGREAEGRFREYFLSQGGIEEEAVTGRLLAELEQAFRSAKARMQSLRGSAGRTPNAALSHRQVAKKEEKTYGCDIAFVVRVDGRRIKGTETAELVQVKKPDRVRGGKAFAPRWRIAKKQLGDILRASGSAAYWLLGVEGEVLVVPAKFLQALVPSGGWTRKDESEGDFSVDYFKIRSAAVPLPQFLVDLLVGLWLGRSDDEAIQFAKGEGRATSPRYIVEIAVGLGGHERG